MMKVLLKICCIINICKVIIKVKLLYVYFMNLNVVNYCIIYNVFDKRI